MVFAELLSMSWTKLKEAFDEYYVRQLINEAFDARPSVRVLARANLKKNYPDVYEQVMEIKQWKDKVSLLYGQ